MVDIYSYESGHKDANGGYVRLHDYEALEARCRELEEELEAASKDLEVHFTLGQSTQAYAQKIREVLKDLVTPFADDPCRHDHHGYCQAHFLELNCCVAKAREALSLTPSSALSQLRDEVREECAKIAECHFDDRGNGRSGHHSEMDWTDGYRDATKGIAAAIRARKEMGE